MLKKDFDRTLPNTTITHRLSGRTFKATSAPENSKITATEGPLTVTITWNDQGTPETIEIRNYHSKEPECLDPDEFDIDLQ